LYIHTLVDEVRKVLLLLRAARGEYKLAMLFNSDLDASTNWNLIVSAEWADELGTMSATRIIARELHRGLGLENKGAISRVTVLKIDDAFVRDMVRLYPTPGHGGGIPLRQVTAGGVTEGAAFVFYSQPEIAV
jgi:hypothetical protein